MAYAPKPVPHLRLTLRHPETLGSKQVVLNDGLHFCDAEGNEIGDLSGFLSESQIIRNVGTVATVRLTLLGVELREEVDQGGLR